jgi:hypothetical protein
MHLAPQLSFVFIYFKLIAESPSSELRSNSSPAPGLGKRVQSGSFHLGRMRPFATKVPFAGSCTLSAVLVAACLAIAASFSIGSLALSCPASTSKCAYYPTTENCTDNPFGPCLCCNATQVCNFAVIRGGPTTLGMRQVCQFGFKSQVCCNKPFVSACGCARPARNAPPQPHRLPCALIADIRRLLSVYCRRCHMLRSPCNGVLRTHRRDAVQPTQRDVLQGRGGVRGHMLPEVVALLEGRRVRRLNMCTMTGVRCICNKV